MKALALAALLVACSAPAGDTCTPATQTDCVQRQAECNSWCAHTCLSQSACLDDCETNTCAPLFVSCPGSCLECVARVDATGPHDVCADD